MARQLALLDTPPEWFIDDDTREAGRVGLARARAALAKVAAEPVQAEDRPTRGRGPVTDGRRRDRTAA